MPRPVLPRQVFVRGGSKRYRLERHAVWPVVTHVVFQGATHVSAFSIRRDGSFDHNNEWELWPTFRRIVINGKDVDDAP